MSQGIFLVVCTLNEVLLCRSFAAEVIVVQSAEDDRFYLEVTQDNWRRATLLHEFSRTADVS